MIIVHAPSCGGDDNLSIALGDANETMLLNVFHHIEEGNCKNPALASIDAKSLNIKRQNDTILNNFQKEIGAI